MNEEKEVLFEKETKSLAGKIFIVSGANRGYGYAITETLVERHATVIMACKDSNKAYEAISKIRLKTATGSLVIHLILQCLFTILNNLFAELCTARFDFLRFDCKLRHNHKTNISRYACDYMQRSC